MAIQAGETTFYQAKRGIVQDGLVLNLDAAVDASYSGGTTWRDLTGGNNGTLTNMTFADNYNTDNGGLLRFDGTNEHIVGSIASSTFTSAHTICCWFYRISRTQWSALFSNNVNTTSCSILTFINDTDRIGTNQAGVNATAIAVNLSTDYFNKWIYAAITYAGVSSGSSVSVYAYKSGSLLTSTGSLYWNMSSGSSYYIARHWASANQIHNGYIPQVSVYNRALTSDEVARNYNATRHRFGV